MNEQLPFDRIVLTAEDGDRPITVEEFLRLPLVDRVQYILRKKIKFYSGIAPVEVQVGLHGLMNLSV